jgi:hypothetical protein
MKIAGVDVPGNDGRVLVDLLLRIGRDADLALAHRIERAYSRQVDEVILSPIESDHLHSALVDCPDGPGELRAALAREHRDRP